MQLWMRTYSHSRLGMLAGWLIDRVSVPPAYPFDAVRRIVPPFGILFPRAATAQQIHQQPVGRRRRLPNRLQPLTKQGVTKPRSVDNLV